MANKYKGKSAAEIVAEHLNSGYTATPIDDELTAMVSDTLKAGMDDIMDDIIENDLDWDKQWKWMTTPDPAGMEALKAAVQVKTYKSLGVGNEGPMWSANLTVNGHKCRVYDSAHGGELDFELVMTAKYKKDHSAFFKAQREMLAEFTKLAKAAYPNYDTDPTEIALSELVQEFGLHRELKRKVKTHFCFKVKGDDRGSYRFVKLAPKGYKPWTIEAATDYFSKEHDIEIIYNSDPRFAEFSGGR